MSGVGINYDVPVVAQTMTMSCWAAAAASILSWKSGSVLTEQQVVQQAGAAYEAAFEANTGLAGTDVASFATALGLSAEPPQNWDVDGYASLLTAHGPLWVGVVLTYDNVPYRHVRILAGLIGDGTFDGTSAFVLDPDGGRNYQESLTDFASELENIARQDLPSGGDLNPQLIHFP
jgi:hypothetical protein